MQTVIYTVIKKEGSGLNNQKEICDKSKFETCKKNFLKNNFNFYLVETPEDAKKLVIGEIISKREIKTVSWGDSITVIKTGLLKEIEDLKSIKFIQTFDSSISREEIIQRRREALTVDLFVTGSNALTEKGQLVNLDMVGNRVASMIFGPKYVVIIAGRNKIVPDISYAINKIRNHTAPINAQRHKFDTPCVFTGKCSDCTHDKRICNYWSIIEKSNPPGRISVVIINSELGL